MEKVTFCYLYYTTSLGGEKSLLGCFNSLKKAKTHFDLAGGDDMTGSMESRTRVLQKANRTTGQIWYVEKHVMKDSI